MIDRQMAIMMRKILVLIVFISSLFYFLFAAFAVKSAGNRSFRMDCVVKRDLLELRIESGKCTITKNGEYDDVAMTGCEPFMSPGNPMLPHRVMRIALPPETDLGTVRIVVAAAEKEVLSGEYRIRPGPPFAACPGGKTEFFWGENKRIIDGKNADVYGKNQAFPGECAVMMTPGIMRKWKFALIEFFPISYNPAKGELTLIKTACVKVFYKAMEHLRRQQVPALADTCMDDAAEAVLDNYSVARQWYARGRQEELISTGGDYSFVIMTTEEIKGNSAELSAFEDFKEGQGFNVLTVTESAEYDDVDGAGSASGWSGGSGDAAAENIRSWLAGNYLSLGIQYALLIGDPHPDTGDVPMKMCWPRSDASDYPTDYIQAPTDYYFADLTGNWDLDGDGLFGEFLGDFGIGGIDAYPEVYAGRIPVYNSDYSALDDILGKTIDYGTSTGDIFWRNKVLLPMEPSDASTHGYPLGEGIRSDYAIPEGWLSYRIYDKDYDCNPEMTPCNMDNVEDEWTNCYGLVTWWTHGGNTEAVDVFDISRCGNLDDDYPSFTFQCSCYNGCPEVSDNLGYSLLKQGAIGTVSASRISYYSGGDGNWKTSGSNNYQAYLYSGNIIRKIRAGKALCWAKNSNAHDRNYRWMNKLVFNLYGDPALKIDDFTGYSVSGMVTLEYPGYSAGLAEMRYQVRSPAPEPVFPLCRGKVGVSVNAGRPASAVITMGHLPDGTYDIAVKMENRTADMVKNVVVDGADVTGLEFTLWAGDGDGNDNMWDIESGDNDVDWYDYYVLYYQYLGQIFPDPIVGCNFDNDFDVDFDDYYGLYYGYLYNPDPGNWY